MHVERKMQRIKSFAILSNKLPNSVFDIMGQMIFVDAALTNFQAALKIGCLRTKIKNVTALS